MQLKLFQKESLKNSRSNLWFNWKKIANRSTKFSKYSQQNSEIVTNEHDKNMPKERQEIVD